MRLLGKCVPIGACYDAACRRGEPLAARVQLRAESGSARLSTRAPLIRIPHGRRLNQIQDPHRHQPSHVPSARQHAPGKRRFERELSPAGERSIWLESAMVQRLKAMHGPGETYSDAILKLIEIEAAR